MAVSSRIGSFHLVKCNEVHLFKTLKQLISGKHVIYHYQMNFQKHYPTIQKSFKETFAIRYYDTIGKSILGETHRYSLYQKTCNV